MDGLTKSSEAREDWHPRLQSRKLRGYTLQGVSILTLTLFCPSNGSEKAGQRINEPRDKVAKMGLCGHPLRQRCWSVPPWVLTKARREKGRMRETEHRFSVLHGLFCRLVS